MLYTCPEDAISRGVEPFAEAAVFWPQFADLTKSSQEPVQHYSDGLAS